MTLVQNIFSDQLKIKSCGILKMPLSICFVAYDWPGGGGAMKYEDSILHILFTFVMACCLNRVRQLAYAYGYTDQLLSSS